MFTRYALFVGIILSLSGLLAACGRSAAPTPAPAIAALPSQPAPTASATPSPAPSPTEAPTATPPATPTEAPTPTPPATATPAPSPTPAPTEAPKPTAEAVKISETLFPIGGTYWGKIINVDGTYGGEAVVARLSGTYYFVFFYHRNPTQIREMGVVAELFGSPSTGYKLLVPDKSPLLLFPIKGMEGFVPVGGGVGKTTTGNLIGSSDKIGQAEFEYKEVGELKKALVIARRAVSQPNGNRSKIGWPINPSDIAKVDELLKRYKVPGY